MALDFSVRDVIHKIAVKFIQAFLPNAKKAYNLKVVNQPELDIHGIASKAAIYNIATSPKVIQEGLSAGMELMYYLVADGYKIKTPVFELKICVPGEYDGNETSLPSGTFPVARLRTSPALRKYLKEKVEIQFNGKDEDESIIAKATDDATGLVGQLMTIGQILTIQGKGLKIESDDKHKDEVGVFFKSKTGSSIKASVIAVNESKTLKVLVPSGLKKGTSYHISVETQSSARNPGSLLKKLRGLESKFSLVAAS